MLRCGRLAILCLSLVVCAGVRADAGDAPSSGAGAVTSGPGALTPRALVEDFLALTDAGDYRDAARLFERSNRSPADLERLVMRLRVVLDQYAPLDLDSLSTNREGDLDDKLPADRERYSPNPHDPDGPGTLVMVHVATDGGERWLISRHTLSRVDGWYHRLPSRWLVERLPPAFARPGPLGLQPWQWVALGGALLFGLLGAFALGRLTGFVLGVLARRTRTRWDDLAVVRLRGPFVFAWFWLVLRMLLPLAAVPERAFGWFEQAMRGGLVAALFWGMIASVDAARVLFAEEASDRPGRRALLGIGGRLLKMLLLLVAIVVILAELGFSVTSLVAGIGVGGLGLALAAQKTVENVFGAFSLGVDQPFREGDVVKVEGVTGTVESIGLRSTRIRTFDRTIVAIPNGKLAEMKTETLTARDRFRLVATLSLRHGVAAAKLREVLVACEAILRAQEKADVDGSARLVNLSAASLDVEVAGSFLTTNGDEFVRIRQEVLLALIDAVERAGVAWATELDARCASKPTLTHT